jgi:hypothetical protein
MPIDLANSRYSGRLGFNHQSDNQRFLAQLSATYGVDDNTLPGWSIAAYALALPPIAPPLYNGDGKLNWGTTGEFINPIARLKEVYNSKIRSLTSSGVLSYELFKGLKVKASVGYNEVQNNALSKRGQDFSDPTTWQARGRFLRLTRNLNLATNTWNAEPQIEYERTLGPGRLTMLVGSTFQKTNREGLVFEANNYADDALMGNPNFGQVYYNFAQRSKYNYHAVFSRVNYNLASKYIFNLTARRDGSAGLHQAGSSGTFAAAGSAWIFSEESFIKKALPFLSFGKLRGSYGSTGNDAIPEYGFLSLYRFDNLYAGAMSLSPTGLYNNGYSWETNRKAEVGLDLGLLKDRVAISASYYNNLSSNQLVAYPLPSIVGFTSVLSNLHAKVQNTGLEIELHTVNVRKRHWNWNSSFNISFPRNELVSYPHLSASSYANTYMEGYPLNIFKTFNIVRVDPETGRNVYRSYRYGFDTVNSNLLSVSSDARIPFNTGKVFFGGFNNSIRYKRFQLDLFFNFSYQTGPSTYTNLFEARGRIGNMPC